MSAFRVSARFASPQQRLLLPAGIAVELYEPQSSDELQRHAHAVDSLNLILEGSLVEHIDGVAQTLHAGTLSLLPRGCEHAVTVGGRGARVLHAEYSQACLDRLPGCAHSTLAACAWLDADTRALAQRGRAQWQCQDAYTSFGLEALAMDALVLALRHGAALPSRVPAWLEQLAQRWRDEPGRTLVMAAEAQLLGMRATALSRHFRRHFGVRLSEFVLAQRMDAACRQLSESTEPLTRIASRLGFADQSHFCRSFQRALGVTPSTYRQQMRPAAV